MVAPWFNYFPPVKIRKENHSVYACVFYIARENSNAIHAVGHRYNLYIIDEKNVLKRKKSLVETFQKLWSNFQTRY